MTMEDGNLKAQREATRLFQENLLSREKRSDAYRSPLEVSSGTGYMGIEAFNYSGTLESAMRELFEQLDSKYPNPHILAHHPSHIISSIIDWNIQNPNPNALSYLRGSIDAAISTRKNVKEGGPLFRNLSTDIFREQTEMFASEIHEEEDLATWMASNPELSYKTAMRLAFKFGGGPMLMVAIAHGAISAGLDVFLRYSDITEQAGSQLHVVRFSKYKKKDEKPQLSQDEIKFLREQAQGKKIVIFEEDTKTYRTSDQSYTFFTQNVFPDRQVFVSANRREFSSKKRPYFI